MRWRKHSSDALSARKYGSKIGELTEDVSTRLLVPTPFSLPTRPSNTASARSSPSHDNPPLPHRATIAPGVHASGFAERFDSANCGWVELAEEMLLIDLPRGMPIPEFLAIARATSGKPARTLLLTHAKTGDAAILKSLIEQGITRVVLSPGTRSMLDAARGGVETRLFQVMGRRGSVVGPDAGIEFLPLDEVACRGGAAVYVRGRSVLFAGPLAAHGRRAALDDSDTARWVEKLRQLESLGAQHVVPGSGSWGGPGLLARQRRYLSELRRQVAYQIAQGRPLSGLYEQVRIPTADLVSMPYDNPTREDVEHVYRELTVPFAPFGSDKPSATDDPPHALVLIGDQPHEPGHIEEGLRPAFEAAGVVPHFTVDVRALTAENLARVRLLVILRDGLRRPTAVANDSVAWMTPEQGRALAAFVEAGGGLLGLHNALGLYPADSAYLSIMAGRYTGHGPLERFRVEVADPDHEVTRGVSAYFAADEQHTPICDEGRAHVLLRSGSDDGKSAPAGWVRDQGRGRVCHLAGGHTREALLHPMYQKLLRNAVRWCLRLRGDTDQDPKA
jgi:type 1 glutamine amidotransferase